MADRGEVSGSCGLLERFDTVFVDTSLDTHLATLVSDLDTVSDLKKRLLREHLLCFPDVGDIKISALKVKRRGHFYHLSDSMYVKKAFEGYGKNWFLFVEAKKVEEERENQQLQLIDSSKHVMCQNIGDEPSSHIDELVNLPVKDQHLKTKPLAYLTGAGKQQLKDFDMESEKVGTDLTNVPLCDAYARPLENVAVDHQKVSVAADRDSLVPGPLEKLKEHSINAELLEGNIGNEAKDVRSNLTPEGVPKTEATEKRKRKSKRKTRSSADRESKEEPKPSHPSTLESAVETHENISRSPDKGSVDVVGNGNTKFEHPENVAPSEIEPSGSGRENAEKSTKAGGDVTQNKDDAKNVQENDKSVKEPSSPQTPARKKRKTEKKPGKENPVPVNVDSMFNTNKAIAVPEPFSPQSSLVDRQKVSNIDVNKPTSGHLEASSGFTTSLKVDKKKKRKKISKDLNQSATAATSSRDLVGGNLAVPTEGEPDAAVSHVQVDPAGVVSESCAKFPTEKRDNSLTVEIEKEVERGEEIVDDDGSEKAKLDAANDLQTTDLAGKQDPSVQDFKRPHNIEGGTYQNIGHKDEKVTPLEDDSEAPADRDDGRINIDEVKPAKPPKGKKKSKKAKNVVKDILVNSSAQHVEGSGTGISSSEPSKPVGGEEPDTVIKSVLESLQQCEENNEGKPSDQINPYHEKENMDVGDNFDSSQTEDNAVDNRKMQDQGANGAREDEGGAKSKMKKKARDLYPDGSANGSQSSTKPNEELGSSEKTWQARPANSSTSQRSSKKNNSFVSLSNKYLQRSSGTKADGDVSEKLDKNSKAANLSTLNGSAARSHSKKMKEPRADSKRSSVNQIHPSTKGVSITKESVKSSGPHRIKDKPKDRERKLLPLSGSLFKDDKYWNSEDDDSDSSSSSTKRPSDALSDDSNEESDATFESRENGSHVLHGKEHDRRNAMSSGLKDMSFENILRSTSRYKKAKLIASQSQPDDCEDESQPFDCVPDSQAN